MTAMSPGKHTSRQMEQEATFRRLNRAHSLKLEGIEENPGFKVESAG